MENGGHAAVPSSPLSSTPTVTLLVRRSTAARDVQAHAATLNMSARNCAELQAFVLRMAEHYPKWKPRGSAQYMETCFLNNSECYNVIMVS